ncbi:MAG: putative 4-mercaptohistidine N1-methyltransferase [Chthoniobacterales bacterium]
MNPYETDKLLAEYLLFHYASPEQVIPPGVPEMAFSADFAVRSVSQTLQPDLLSKPARALDLGCAVGRSSFELARHCEEVIGVDFSQRFIAAARAVKESGFAEFNRCEEGHLATALRNFLPSEIKRHRVQFETGDAMHLRPGLGEFDVVHAANLIDRLPEPLRLLRQLPALVKPGGQLILTSPYTWLEEYTPQANWLGGFYQNERAVTTYERLQLELPDFLLLTTQDLPFLIREHARKYQWSIAQATIWVRR